MTGDRWVIPAASLILELRLHCHVGVPHPLAQGITAWRVEQVANAGPTAGLEMVTMWMGGLKNEKLDKSRDYPAKRVVLLMVLEAKGSRAIVHLLARVKGTEKVTGNVTENVAGTGMGSATVIGNATRSATESGRRRRIGSVVTEIENEIETGIGTGIATAVMTRIVIESHARTEIDQAKL